MTPKQRLRHEFMLQQLIITINNRTMRGKRAKQLRRQAEAKTVGKPEKVTRRLYQHLKSAWVLTKGRIA
jgi:hypothetical protein